MHQIISFYSVFLIIFRTVFYLISMKRSLLIVFVKYPGDKQANRYIMSNIWYFQISFAIVFLSWRCIGVAQNACLSCFPIVPCYMQQAFFLSSILDVGLYVGRLLSRHYGLRCHGGETERQGVGLCFLGRRPPASLYP